jgi:hypothetical protein
MKNEVTHENKKNPSLCGRDNQSSRLIDFGALASAAVPAELTSANSNLH